MTPEKPPGLGIVIAGEFPLPVGLASTNRLMSLARGLVENGVRVHTLALRPLERPEEGIVNREARGVFNGIPFEYPCGTSVRAGTFLARRMQMAKGMLRTARIVKDFRRNGERTILFCYPVGLISSLFLFFVSRTLGVTLMFEENEFPDVRFSDAHRGKLYAIVYTAVVFRLPDIVLVMTGPLEEYFRHRIRADAAMFRVLMTVEMSRFLVKPPPDGEPVRYVAYCGELAGNKDGVPILLRAYAAVRGQHPDVRLVIIGDEPRTNDLANLKALARELQIDTQVCFTGRVHRDEVPRYLCNAAVLALARPKSLQAEGGFPTKLGEYLATGNPVVVTKVGDIPRYLEDGKTAFLADPDSVEAFAGKLNQALGNPDLARRVGENGRALALATFDYRVQAAGLLRFLAQYLTQQGEH